MEREGHRAGHRLEVPVRKRHRIPERDIAEIVQDERYWKFDPVAAIHPNKKADFRWNNRCRRLFFECGDRLEEIFLGNREDTNQIKKLPSDGINSVGETPQ